MCKRERERKKRERQREGDRYSNRYPKPLEERLLKSTSDGEYW